ncbi:MAG: hypothetical protein AAGA75_05490 [Cyanobacteria bacterium P01_E01_bin.6]
MSISKDEARRMLQRMIFDDSLPQEWVQDVWGLSPLLGDSAAKLLEAFDGLVECCSDEKLENYLLSLYSDQMQDTEP